MNEPIIIFTLIVFLVTHNSCVESFCRGYSVARHQHQSSISPPEFTSPIIKHPSTSCQHINDHDNDAHARKSTLLHIRPKNKWDDLIDEDDDVDESLTSNDAQQSEAGNDAVPLDMLYNDANILRQANTYDQLESIGGKDLMSDVYVRVSGEREWWLVGKVARISGTILFS